MEQQYEFTVVLERDEDGAVIATVPALPGCHSAGDTEAEALTLIRDAIKLHIEARRALNEPIAEDLGATRVRVAV
ncbi:MAG: type II toxin-antitoxin system HicB family antitoxin [Chloroflexota bacterium]